MGIGGHLYCALPIQLAGLHIIRSRRAGSHTLCGHKVYQIMHMQRIAAGKNAGHRGLPVLIHQRAVGAWIHNDSGVPGQFILRNQPHGQQHRVAVKGHLRTGNGTALVVHLGHYHLLHPGFAPNVRNGVGQIQRNIKILQALHNVALQPAGIRHYLYAGQHLGALQGHTPSHNQPNVTGAENDHTLAHHVALHIHIPLGSTGSEHTGRARAGNGDGAAGALSAPHGQHDALGLQHPVALFLAYRVHLLLRGHLEHHGVQEYLHAGVRHHGGKARGVLRTGKLLFEVMQAKAVMDTLVENTAQFFVPL